MFPRTSLQYWAGRFLLGIALLIAAGFGLVPSVLGVDDEIGLLSLLAGIVGFHFALAAVTPLVRLLSRGAHLRTAWDREAREAFERASLPRRIYYLLASVAEADGPMSTSERAAVQHFVLERFADPVHSEEFRLWAATPVSIADRTGLAARVANGLDDGELDTLFVWCCLVAFADGRFDENAHHALHDVSKGLGIGAPRARMLFHLARAQFLGGKRRGDAAAPPQVDARERALAVLGLAPSATPEQIRKRHRELVRKFHPDVQPNLGPVAQREATERFTAIQRAYEVLSA